MITYYEEQADPPEAHPEVNQEGYVQLAETVCDVDGDGALSRHRAFFESVGLDLLECDEAELRCFCPALAFDRRSCRPAP